MRKTKTMLTLLLSAAAAMTQAPSARAQSAQYLDQGWTSSDRQYFYRTSQGSRLLSYRVFMGLETDIVVGGGFQRVRFMSQAHLQPLGFLFDSNVGNNPDGLPVGFVKDSSVSSRPDAIGFTCATCHSRDVSFKGPTGVSTRYRIDGGQSAIDMEKMLLRLEGALGAAVTNPVVFDRLCTNVGVSTTSARQQLRTELEQAYTKLQEENLANISWKAGWHGINNPGPGRVDAFAHIKNRVANTVFPGQYAFAGNDIDATAPVSYPFLWDSPYLSHVQYPTNATNAGIGSLARNVGEVTGVFAETSSARNYGVFTASNTADIPNLVELENKVLKLKSPVWPSALSPLNQAQVTRGDQLFGQYCASCHAELDRAPRTTWIPVVAVGANVVGTDPTQADNNLNDRAFAGQISADASRLVNPLEILGYVVANVVLGDLIRAPFLTATHKQSGAPTTPGMDLAPLEDPKHSYKARPLNGIWATGPYLHNGSVRTLADLLLPGSQRPTTFCLGSLEIDTVGVGMKSDCSLSNVYTFDTTKPANYAGGHEYGTTSDPRVVNGTLPALDAADRAALVEYMKTL